MEGPLFAQLHNLFQTIYEEVYGSIDDFAEKIENGQIKQGTKIKTNIKLHISVKDALELQKQASFKNKYLLLNILKHCVYLISLTNFSICLI